MLMEVVSVRWKVESLAQVHSEVPVQDQGQIEMLDLALVLTEVDLVDPDCCCFYYDMYLDHAVAEDQIDQK
jgi:hypothetical protein